IDITPPEQLESPPVASKADKGNSVATKETEEPTMKLVPASREVCQDPDEPIRVPYEIHGKIYQLTNDEIQAHMDKKRKSRKLLRKQSVDLKILASAKGGQEFKKIQDVELQVLNREYSQKIHPNIKPAVLTIHRGNDRRNFDVHNLFKFVNFGVTELDELGPIIENKKNKIVGEKRKHMELELEIRVAGMECNISLPEGVPYINNMVIEEPEYGMFFIDVFGDGAF
ncbi:hypothetical protein Tco_1267258, partial [Tanacetum coccineum]